MNIIYCRYLLNTKVSVDKYNINCFYLSNAHYSKIIIFGIQIMVLRENFELGHLTKYTNKIFTIKKLQIFK